MRSTARMTTVSQAAWIANDRRKVTTPVSLACGRFNPGVGSVSGIEMGELPDVGVGGGGGVAPAVALLEGIKLGAGVRALAVHDHPCSRR